MNRLIGCLGNVFSLSVIILLGIYFIFSQIAQNIMQVDTIGNFDFELYKENVLMIRMPRRYYRVSDANYSVYDQRYKLTEIESGLLDPKVGLLFNDKMDKYEDEEGVKVDVKADLVNFRRRAKESKKIQGTLEKNQVLIIRGVLDIQYTKYTAIDYFSNNKVNHGYIITPKDNPPYFETMLTSENAKYVKYFNEASINLYKNFKKKIKNLYSISSNDTQSQIFVDKGYTEFEYLKEAAEVINEIVDDNHVPFWGDLIIKVKEQKVFCDEISCEKIKSIFNETFSEDNLKKYYFTLKIN